MEGQSEEVGRLLGAALEEGAVSDETQRALNAVPHAADEIAAALGEPSASRELLLATILADDSGSMSGRDDAVRRGHNLLLEVLRDNRTAGSAEVLVHTRYLNGRVLSPYRPLASALEMTRSNYDTRGGGTPLYDASVLTLGSVLTKTKEAEARAQHVRTFTLIITDGVDNKSRSATARSVSWPVQDMLAFATNHIVAGMGIGNKHIFDQVFSHMGIPSRSILTADSTAADIARVFQIFASSLSLAASSEAGFYELTRGPVEDDDDD